jgi:hypothetical protein
MKIDTITYCFFHQTPMPKSTEALILSVQDTLNALKTLQKPQTLRAKGAHPTFKEFTRQAQHLARVPTAHSPLKQAKVLVELNNVAQPCFTR